MKRNKIKEFENTMIGFTNYFVITNYEIIPPIKNDFCGTFRDSTGMWPLLLRKLTRD